jgi:HSP20 family protein
VGAIVFWTKPASFGTPEVISYPESVSIHRRERSSGEFDRTRSIPVRIDADAIKAECRDGVLALHLPRLERDKPRTINIA